MTYREIEDLQVSAAQAVGAARRLTPPARNREWNILSNAVVKAATLYAEAVATNPEPLSPQQHIRAAQAALNGAFNCCKEDNYQGVAELLMIADEHISTAKTNAMRLDIDSLAL